MPANYVLLGEVTVTQTTSFITISNIPQSGYTDLKLVASVRALRTGFPADDLVIQFNGVTSGYSGRRLYGLASSVSSDTQADIRGFASDVDQTANVFGSNEFYIPNYLSTTTAKSVSVDMVTETNGTDAPIGFFAGLWNPGTQAAINSIKVFCNNSNMVAGSTFYLYGIAAVGTTPVIAPFATGGDVISNDGTYWIHTFLSSGTFTPAKTLTCDYLVVAGGGGGGGGHGGGGGAGGYRTSIGGSTISAAAQAYSITVGAGGAGGYAYASISDGVSGSNSVFSTITSTAGGGGGGYNNNTGTLNNGKSGGSGGGGVGQRTSSGGTATSGQGNNGGSTTQDPGAGGGGANAVGGNGGGASNAAAGNGGNGTANSITGTSVTYAGGGGGGNGTLGAAGTGGSGGGGAGSNAAQGVGTNGTANTGGGAGGGGGGSPTGAAPAGGTGGSGIVIVRYPIA